MENWCTCPSGWQGSYDYYLIFMILVLVDDNDTDYVSVGVSNDCNVFVSVQ